MRTFVLVACLCLLPSLAAAQTVNCTNPSQPVNEDQTFRLAFCTNVPNLTNVKMRVDSETTDRFNAALNAVAGPDASAKYAYLVPVDLKLSKGAHSVIFTLSNADGTVVSPPVTFTILARPVPPAAPTSIQLIVQGN